MRIAGVCASECLRASALVTQLPDTFPLLLYCMLLSLALTAFSHNAFPFSHCASRGSQSMLRCAQVFTAVYEHDVCMHVCVWNRGEGGVRGCVLRMCVGQCVCLYLSFA